MARSGETEEDTRKAVVAILATCAGTGCQRPERTQRLDGVPLDAATLRVPASALEAARTDLDGSTTSWRLSARLIASVRRSQKANGAAAGPGAVPARRWNRGRTLVPLKTAGVYIPAAVPSILHLGHDRHSRSGGGRGAHCGRHAPQGAAHLPGAWGIDPLCWPVRRSWGSPNSILRRRPGPGLAGLWRTSRGSHRRSGQPVRGGANGN